MDLGGRHVALVSGEEAASARSLAESARARLSAAAAHIAEQQARVAQLKLVVQHSEIRAPFADVVSAINFEPGMTVHPGHVVARVVASRFVIEGNVRVGSARADDELRVLTGRGVRAVLLPWCGTAHGSARRAARTVGESASSGERRAVRPSHECPGCVRRAGAESSNHTA